MIEDRVVKYIEMVQGGPSSVSMAYHVSLNDTTVVIGVVTCTRFNAIVGGVFSQHSI